MADCLHAYVSGRVQGVFFRAHKQKEAHELGLVGWVRNLSDGRVEILAEGPKPALRELAAWCKGEGAPSSSVEGVEEEWPKAEGKFTMFTIRS